MKNLYKSEVILQPTTVDPTKAIHRFQTLGLCILKYDFIRCNIADSCFEPFVEVLQSMSSSQNMEMLENQIQKYLTGVNEIKNDKFL